MKAIVAYLFLGTIIAITGCQKQPTATNTITDFESTAKQSNVESETMTSVSVTEEKYKKIKNGMTVNQVERIMGGKGEKQVMRINEMKEVSYFWLNEDTFKIISISVEDGKVTGKAML